MPTRVLPEPIVLSEQDVLDANVDEVLSAESVDRIEDMASPLAAAGERFEQEGQDGAAAVLIMLSAAATFWLNLDEPKDALRSVGHVGTMKFIGPEDLVEGHLDMLETILPHLTNDELIARVADLLWQQRKKPLFANVKTAIAAYLSRAKALETNDSWTTPFKRLKRAFQLATAIGSSNPDAKNVETYAVDLLGRLGDSQESFYMDALAELILDTDRTPAQRLSVARQAESIASKANSVGDYNRARRHYMAASKWYRRLEMPDDIARMELAGGETYVSEAMTRDPMVRGMLLSQAVVALRNAKVAPERLVEVRRMQAEAAKQGLTEMKTISEGVDLTEIAAKSRARANGLSASDGLLKLASINGIPTAAKLRKAVEDQMAAAPLRHLFSTQTVDSQGRVLGVRGSALSKDADAAAAAIESEMMRQAVIEWQLIVYGVILPFVDAFTLENRVGLLELVEFVTDRPFVPPGRELLFARGLQFGFLGDFATAASVLVPQVEHALRTLLADAGELPYKHDPLGVQDFWHLGRILDEPKLKELLGVDEVFDLRALLTNRSGANFRNNVAHGLIGLGGLKGFASIYLWWRTIYLIGNLAVTNEEPPTAAPSPGR